MRLVFSALFFCLLFSVSTSATAHQQKTALTEILFNERSGNLEISHRYILHDAEHALGLKKISGVDLYSSEESRFAFYHYVLKNFSLKINQEAADLINLGFEMDERYFWIYQEIPLPESVFRLDILQSSLTEIWPDQTNVINIRQRGDLHSMELNSEKIIDTVFFPF